ASGEYLGSRASCEGLLPRMPRRHGAVARPSRCARLRSGVLFRQPRHAKEDVVPPTKNGAEVLLERLRTNGIDCVFASPIAVMAPLWEAFAERRERGEAETPRYYQ